jgi:hypothetical protein
MKDIFKLVKMGVVTGMAVGCGYWLWDNVLEDKVEKLYYKYQEKKMKKYM